MSKSLFSLDDRAVVVTGGLGQLGRAFVKGLVQAGARVAVFDSASGDIRDLVPEARDRVEAFRVDVTSRESVEAGLRAVEARFGVPSGLVNAAALDSPPNAPAEENGPFETYPEESFDRVMAVNVKGTMIASQVIGAAMAKAGRGSIVNIGSIYGIVSPDQRIYEYRRQEGQSFYKPVAYSISKSALINFTRYLATYFATSGVRVNTVTFAGVFNHQDPRFLEAYTAKVPLGRMADAEEYIGPIVFLLSQASSYMTGSNLVVDGGFTAW
jgi:NAD(P)-dependent dehydrogenase (short-subunit alcohol dehydrogenase family)